MVCRFRARWAMAGKIFINYRREDSISTAGRLHDRLAQTFGRKNLFMDVDHIPAGADFVEYLNSQVAACDVFLAVIGPNWLEAKDDDGRRRFDNPDDFVTIEIAAALARKEIRVIPVLVDGARTPKADKLPDSVKPLMRRNAVEVRNTHFGRDAEALTQKVRAVTGRWPFLTSVGAWLMTPGHWRTVAASATALVLVAWIGLYQVGVPVWVPWAEHPDPARADKAKAAADAEAQRKAEEEAKPAAEAAAQRKAEEAEQQRLAAAKAEEERKAKAAAEADARAKAEQAEKERLAAAKAQPTPANTPPTALEQAAAKGDAHAMFRLGLVYASGEGVAQDYAKAREWYEKAAAKGDTGAMQNLGWAYESGEGVAQDYAKAREWYEKAAANGAAWAKRSLEQLAEKAARGKR